MPHTADRPPPEHRDDEADAVYREVLDTLAAAGVDCLVGGAYALARYTACERPTKDLDLFLRPADLEPALQALDAAGFRTEHTHPHWLCKAYRGEVFVDLIHNSGNGVTPVDDEWFRHATPAELLGRSVQLVPAEELMWSKLYIMERERYDGADVAHLLRECADHLAWPRLLRRAGPHWRVLLSHLVLFGFVYPGERARVPESVMRPLLQRLQQELHAPAPGGKLCMGTLLSREQYLPDVERDGWLDARLTPHSSMSAQDVAHWTEAIHEPHDLPSANNAPHAQNGAPTASTASTAPTAPAATAGTLTAAPGVEEHGGVGPRPADALG